MSGEFEGEREFGSDDGSDDDVYADEDDESDKIANH